MFSTWSMWLKLEKELNRSPDEMEEVKKVLERNWIRTLSEWELCQSEVIRWPSSAVECAAA